MFMIIIVVVVIRILRLERFAEYRTSCPDRRIYSRPIRRFCEQNLTFSHSLSIIATNSKTHSNSSLLNAQTAE